MKARWSRRWLLWAYPKAYREERGQEILATLDELAPVGTRLDAGQVLSCWLHGVRLRVISTPPVVAALVLFVSAIVACVGVDLARPPAYRASSVVRVGGASSTAMVAAQMRDPSVRRIAASLSGSPLAACTATPTPGGHATMLAIKCTSGTSPSAASEANALVAAYNRSLVLGILRQDTGLITDASRWIDIASARLRSASSSVWPALQREIAHVRAWRAHVRRTSALISLDGVQVGKLRLVGLTVVAYAAPGAELSRVSTVDLWIAGLVGMAVALTAASMLRRRHVPSWAA